MIAMPHDGPRPGPALEDLDFRNIRFPSDGITVRRLRELHPDLFDHGYHAGGGAQPVYLLRPEEAGHVTDRLGNLLFIERFVVASAYAAAERIDPPEGEPDALIEELSNLYLRYGLASGPQHAAQLIRDLETAGRQLSSARAP